MPKTEHWQWYVETSAPTEAHHHAIDTVYYAGRSDFQQVSVISTPVFGKMLILDGDTQSSQGDEKIYHESKKYLPEWADGAFDEPRANVVIGDALAYMREHDETYGVIISDLTEPLEDSPSNILFNEDVFRLIKSRLAKDGVYVLQASTAAFHNLSLHCKMARTLRRHYAHVTSFFQYVPAFDTDWAFLACSDSVDLAALDPSAVDAYCKQLRGENFFYDGQTHRRLFSLPLYLRRALAADGPVF